MPRPGEVIGRGRVADVVVLDAHTVVRRGRPGTDATGLARLLRHVREAGCPVPAVVGVDGPDLAMELVAGPDLAGALRAGVLDVAGVGRVLGELHARLDDVPAPEWLAREPAADPAATALVHLDLHPENVLLGPDGPVLLDWENARIGDRALDVAVTAVILRSAPRAVALLGDGMRELTDALGAASGIDPDAALERAVEYRLRDRALTPPERDAVRALLD